MSRNKIRVPKNELEKYASRGLSDQQLADVFKIPLKEFTEALRDNKDLELALGYSRSKSIHDVAGALYQRAMEGSVQAQIFFLKAVAGWRDNVEIEKPRELNLHAEFKVTDPIEAAKLYQQFMKD